MAVLISIKPFKIAIKEAKLISEAPLTCLIHSSLKVCLQLTRIEADSPTGPSLSSHTVMEAFIKETEHLPFLTKAPNFICAVPTSPEPT